MEINGWSFLLKFQGQRNIHEKFLLALKVTKKKCIKTEIQPAKEKFI